VADILICILLDNHFADKSKEIMAFLATRPGRFEFVFTPAPASTTAATPKAATIGNLKPFGRRTGGTTSSGIAASIAIQKACALGKRSSGAFRSARCST
jgi:hypothetical protein